MSLNVSLEMSWRGKESKEGSDFCTEAEAGFSVSPLVGLGQALYTALALKLRTDVQPFTLRNDQSQVKSTTFLHRIHSQIHCLVNTLRHPIS